MIRNPQFWHEWEEGEIRRTPPDYWHNLRIMEAMYEHARALGAFSEDSSDALQTKIAMARVINVSRATGKDRPRA